MIRFGFLSVFPVYADDLLLTAAMLYLRGFSSYPVCPQSGWRNDPSGNVLSQRGRKHGKWVVRLTCFVCVCVCVCVCVYTFSFIVTKQLVHF